MQDIINNIQKRLNTPLYKRMAIFVFIWFVGLPLFFHQVYANFHLDKYAGFAYSTTITPVIFFLLYWIFQKDLSKYKFKNNIKQTSIFLVLSGAVLYFYLSLYQIVVWLITKQGINNHWLNMTLIYASLIGLHFLIFIAIFGQNFVKSFGQIIKNFFIFNILYYGLFLAAFPHWGVFSKIASIAAYHLLKIFYKNVDILIEGDNVGLFLNNFSVGIGQTCSGVMLILLFITLYSLFCFIKPKIVNTKKAAFFLILGTLGAYALNIFRIFMIVIIGTFDPERALSLFHDNSAWIMFVGYFFLYLAFSYPQIRISPNNSDSSKHSKNKS